MEDILMGVPRDCCCVVVLCFFILKVTVSRPAGSDTRTVFLLCVVRTLPGIFAAGRHPEADAAQKGAYGGGA